MLHSVVSYIINDAKAADSHTSLRRLLAEEYSLATDVSSRAQLDFMPHVQRHETNPANDVAILLRADGRLS
jgi:hypothetical protein